MPAERPAHAPRAIDEDTPRTIIARPSTGDKIFRAILRASGWSVFVITGMILVFLILRASKAFRFMGIGFLTTQNWIIYNPQHFGIAAILPLGILIAVIAVCIAVPGCSESAPRLRDRVRAGQTAAAVDLVHRRARRDTQSLIHGLWDACATSSRAKIELSRWLGSHVGFVPVPFHAKDPENLASYPASTFIAGIVVALMIVPDPHSRSCGECSRRHRR